MIFIGFPLRIHCVGFFYAQSETKLLHSWKKQHRKTHLLATSMILRDTELCAVRTPTSRSFLFTFLSFLPLWKFSKSFSSFLKFGNKILNVIQNMVQNLLWKKRKITVSLQNLLAEILQKSKWLHSQTPTASSGQNPCSNIAYLD